MISDPFPPPLARLCHAWAFTHVGKYVQAMLTSNILIMKLQQLGSFFSSIANVNFPFFIEIFYPKKKVIFK
jgi:hypothetical protein